jgi:hypothetical protein
MSKLRTKLKVNLIIKGFVGDTNVCTKKFVCGHHGMFLDIHSTFHPAEDGGVVDTLRYFSCDGTVIRLTVQGL